MLGRIVKAPFYGAFLLSVVLSTVSGCAAEEPRKVEIKHVVDGDTVVLKDGEIIRLLGINTPEKERENQPAQPYALEALLTMRELVEGKPARLVIGQQQSDSYGRTLGYLELPDKTDLQKILIDRGYAFVVAFPPDIDRLEIYLKAEAVARNNQLGIWRDQYYRPLELDRETDIKPGFGLFRGTVSSVKKSQKNLLVKLSDDLTVTIRRLQWKEFWRDNPDSLEQKLVEARGWVSVGEKTNFLRVRHPAMLRVIQ